MWKIFIEFFQYGFYFVRLFFFLKPRGMWDLSSLPNLHTAHPALEGKDSTPGPPG